MEIQGYNMPEDLYYEENHFWVKEEGDLLVMGMDDFAQTMAGEIVYIQLPEDGKKLKAGEKICENRIRQMAWESIRACKRRNRHGQRGIGNQPGLVNDDCYGKGWIYKIKPDDKGELANLIQGKDAIEKWLAADIIKYAEQ